MGQALFDRVVVVDWSAASTPVTGADSVWIAVDEPRARPVSSDTELINPATRHQALDLLGSIVDRGGRTLVGIDASLGYPAGTARAVGAHDAAVAERGAGSWSAMWSLLADRISDDERNRNNRFDVARDLNVQIARSIGQISPSGGPFWGCPAQRADHRLASTKPDEWMPAWPGYWRHVESAMRDARRRPFSSWQLLGAGAVGSQSLTAIAGLERLRRHAAHWHVDVWPYSTGLAPPPMPDRLISHTRPSVVFAEVWPSWWSVEVPEAMAKDAAQVAAAARRLSSADLDGSLSAWFRPDLEPVTAAAVVDEEGWVLGVG